MNLSEIHRLQLNIDVVLKLLTRALLRKGGCKIVMFSCLMHSLYTDNTPQVINCWTV